jgi:hypothetical protein
MKSLKTLPFVAAFLCPLFGYARSAHATDISGTIDTTLTIFEDSQLVGDVTCTVTGAPCIAFGASKITLRLNRFTMTGLANPQVPCDGSGAGEIGIDVNAQSDDVILGPGLVQQFHQFGIRLMGSTGGAVRQVTLSSNCFSGIIVIAGSTNELEANLSVRNGSPAAPCGGI